MSGSPTDQLRAYMHKRLAEHEERLKALEVNIVDLRDRLERAGLIAPLSAEPEPPK